MINHVCHNNDHKNHHENRWEMTSIYQRSIISAERKADRQVHALIKVFASRPWCGGEWRKRRLDQTKVAQKLKAGEVAIRNEVNNGSMTEPYLSVCLALLMGGLSWSVWSGNNR